MKNNVSEVIDIHLKEINNNPDLKWIISRKALYRFLAVYFPESNGKLKGLKGKDVDIDEARVEEKLKQILDKEIDSFINNELAKYKRKYTSDYINDIKKARDEDNKKALYNLLEWDKAWLKMDWVVERILQAQDKDDFNFLRTVGEAIAKQPGSSTKPATEKDVIQDIKCLSDLIDIKREDSALIKDLHNRLIEAGTISDKKADYNYFVKWLSRHKII